MKPEVLFKNQLGLLTSMYLNNPYIRAAGKNFYDLSKISKALGDQELTCLLIEAAKSFDEFLELVKRLNRFVDSGKLKYTV